MTGKEGWIHQQQRSLFPVAKRTRHQPSSPTWSLTEALSCSIDCSCALLSWFLQETTLASSSCARETRSNITVDPILARHASSRSWYKWSASAKVNVPDWLASISNTGGTAGYDRGRLQARLCDRQATPTHQCLPSSLSHAYLNQILITSSSVITSDKNLILMLKQLESS